MDIYRDFTLYAANATRRLRARFKERLPAGGPSPMEWIALLWIAEARDGLPQSQLAERMDIEEVPLTRLVNSLVEQGLVKREVSERDRRAKILRLLPAAQPYLEEGEAVARKLREEAFAGVSADDVAICIRVLRRVASRL